jgi:hypothetical protein
MLGLPSRWGSGPGAGIFAALVCAGATLPIRAAESIPDFVGNGHVAWVLDGTTDDLLPPAAGPGPITFDPAHPYIPNFRDRPPTYRVADLTNPILQSWARAQMKKSNDDVLAGKVPFRARERCWPAGVPGFVINSLVAPYYFYQLPKEVLLINEGGPEIRHVYLDVPHSADPKPSWYGESIGHYQGGDTLAIDTIGLSDRTFVDNYRTPHTTKLHVIERFRLVANGSKIEISIDVADPGAFTTAWSATQRWKRVEREALPEALCNETGVDYFGPQGVPMPSASKSDF